MSTEQSELFKFEKATLYLHPLIVRPEAAEKKCDITTRVARAFTESMTQVDLLGSLPLRLLAYNSLSLTCMLRAQSDLGIIHTPQVLESDDDLAERVTARANEIKTQWASGFPNEDERTDVQRRFAANLLNRLIDSPGNGIDIGIQAVLRAMILNAWAAFEALCCDLWEVALNYGPLDWVKDTYKKDKEIDEKRFTVGQLEQVGFDLNHKMGTLLRTKLQFDDFRKVKKAYSDVFGERCSAIFNQEGRRDRLTLLEEFRHLLTHRGSRVDEKFQSKTKHIEMENRPPVGEILGLNGELVADCISQAAACADDLLNYIDKRLIESGYPSIEEQHQS